MLLVDSLFLKCFVHPGTCVKPWRAVSVGRPSGLRSGGRRVAMLPTGPLLCGKELWAWQRLGCAAARCGQAALPTSPRAGRHLKVRKVVPSFHLSVKQAKISLWERHCDWATPQEARSQICCPGIVLGSLQEEKHLRQVPTETTQVVYQEQGAVAGPPEVCRCPRPCSCLGGALWGRGFCSSPPCSRASAQLLGSGECFKCAAGLLWQHWTISKYIWRMFKPDSGLTVYPIYLAEWDAVPRSVLGQLRCPATVVRLCSTESNMSCQKTELLLPLWLQRKFIQMCLCSSSPLSGELHRLHSPRRAQFGLFFLNMQTYCKCQDQICWAKGAPFVWGAWQWVMLEQEKFYFGQHQEEKLSELRKLDNGCIKLACLLSCQKKYWCYQQTQREEDVTYLVSLSMWKPGMRCWLSRASAPFVSPRCLTHSLLPEKQVIRGKKNNLMKDYFYLPTLFQGRKAFHFLKVVHKGLSPVMIMPMW